MTVEFDCTVMKLGINNKPKSYVSGNLSLIRGVYRK